MHNIKTVIYRHYKNKEYRVLGVARHTETCESMVVYQALYHSAEFGDHALWVRPLDMFFEKVTIDGKQMPRFEYVRDN